MGKRYYCDFCERSFADSGVNRKNHFKGLQHQRAKKQHYDAFRDASTILAEDAMKLPCKRFYQGACDYGTSCKFSHMTPEHRQILQERVTAEKAEKERRLQEETKEPRLDEWLEKRQKRLHKDEDNKGTEATGHIEDVQYELPPFLAAIPNLPPSLLPPTSEELKNKSQCDWG